MHCENEELNKKKEKKRHKKDGKLKKKKRKMTEVTLTSGIKVTGCYYAA